MEILYSDYAKGRRKRFRVKSLQWCWFRVSFGNVVIVKIIEGACCAVMLKYDDEETSPETWSSWKKMNLILKKRIK